MTVFRLHIRPGGGRKNPHESFAYCLQEKVLGVGWPTNSTKEITCWEDYVAEAGKQSYRRPRVAYLRQQVKKDDLIWTRSPAGKYYLAKVASEWEYLTSEQALNADVVNVVRCELFQVYHVDSVPGKVTACFRARGTIQRIAGDETSAYSRHLWNTLSGTEFYPSSRKQGANLFSFLSAEAAEDVIFLYLQTQGWLVVPNSRKADTMSFEFYLIHRETRERAVVQVKTGNTTLNTESWKDWPERVFLFQANGLYTGGSHPSVECLAPAQVIAFMESNRDLLPANILFWLNHVGSDVAALPASV